MLAKAPKPSSESLSKDVNLPDPKPAPPNAKPFRFLCRGGKIYPIDDKRLIGRVTQELKKAGLKPNKAKEYDGKKFWLIFQSLNPEIIFFRPSLVSMRTNASSLIWRKKTDAGEDEAALTKGSSVTWLLLIPSLPKVIISNSKSMPIVLPLIFPLGTWQASETFLPDGNPLAGDLRPTARLPCGTFMTWGGPHSLHPSLLHPSRAVSPLPRKNRRTSWIRELGTAFPRRVDLFLYQKFVVH